MVAGVPKYVSVRDNLRLRAQAMEVGEQLPPEPELCQQYNVSRITLRHAIGDLIQDGLLVREQGRGTFRAEGNRETQREVISDHIRGFYRQQQELGNVVATSVVSNTVVRDAAAAARLGLSADDDLIRLERLRYVSGVLKQHVVTYLEAKRFSKVLDHDFSSGSLYGFLEQAYAVHMVENEVVVRIEPLGEKLAQIFGVSEGCPTLAMDSTVVDGFGSIIAFGTALHAPSQAEIKFIIRGRKDVGPVAH